MYVYICFGFSDNFTEWVTRKRKGVNQNSAWNNLLTVSVYILEYKLMQTVKILNQILEET